MSLALARPAFAAGEPAKLAADEVTFNYESQRLIAIGHARLVYKDLTVTADRIEVDLTANTMVASGQVILQDKDRTMEADELTYDLDNEGGRLGPFRGKLDDVGAKGTIYFSGQELTQSEEKTTASDLSLTTCSLAEPHYHFTAAKIEYYPHDRIILRKVFYWEGHLRLLYLPYLAISLRERQNSFSFPRFGYNAEEGLFLKLAYNFFVGDDQSGVILLDLMERKGVGEGLEYTWEFSTGSSLTGLVYHLDNKLTGGDDYRGELGVIVPLDKLKLEGKFGYQDQSQMTGRLQSYQVGLKAAPRQGTGPQGTLNYSESDSPIQDLATFDTAVNGSWSLWTGAQLSLAGRWYWQDTDGIRTRYMDYYNARFTQGWAWGNLQLLANSAAGITYNPDDDTTTPDVSRILPELRLEIPRWEPWPKLGTIRMLLDYQHKFSDKYGVVDEGQRLAGDLNMDSRNLATFGPFTLQAGVWVRGRTYDTDEVVWGAAPGLTLTTKVGKDLEFKTGLSWVFTDGTPPSLFQSMDAMTPRGNLTVNAAYRHEAWRANLATKYAFLSEVWDPITFSLYGSSPDGDQLSFATSYNPQTAIFGLTTLGLGWQPKKDWSFKLSASYEPASAAWRQLDFLSALKQPLGEKFAVSLNTRYDFFSESWLQSLVTLDYKWHCRTLSLGYDWTRSEISLTVLINAFPEHPFKLAYSEGGFYYTPPFILP